MCQSLLAVEAEGFQTAVAKHFDDLGVFLTFFFEGQLALFVVVFVFAAAPVFASLGRKGVSKGGRGERGWVFACVCVCVCRRKTWWRS
jgi:hypothetical protein